MTNPRLPLPQAWPRARAEIQVANAGSSPIGWRGGSVPALLLLIIALLSASFCWAAEDAKRLYSRGLVEFHAERYSRALQFFDQAVSASPDDPYALYYRGVTKARLGDIDGAIGDLHKVALRDTPIKQASLDLGVALVQAGRYSEAVPWLERAQKTQGLEARASLFLGMAQLRSGELTEARRNFELANQRDPSLRLSAEYYLGIVDYQEGRWSDAREHFSYVAGASPKSEMGREATTFLRSLGPGGRPTYELYGSFGLQYDSNVVLAPADDVVKDDLSIANQADGRGTILVGGAWVPWRTDHIELSVGYEFYQSLHFELTSFNLQDHRPNAQIVFSSNIFQVGLYGRYDYYFLETSSFLQEAIASPWLGIDEGDWARTELFYRFRWRDFLDESFGTRDAHNNSGGFRQYLYLDTPSRNVWVGYAYDREDPNISEGDRFGYDGNQVGTGVGWAFPADFTAEASYAYRHEDYDPASNGRVDNVHQFLVGLTNQLTENFALTAAYFGTLNNSNQDLFQYDRHIGSIALDVTFH